MNWSGLPPLNSLRAFAAVAETGSFIKAGELLNVTHAAVSQQVKLLEERLSLHLIAPHGRGIRLTSDGLTLAHELNKGFSVIRYGVDRVLDSSKTHPIQLSTSPAFAMEWLMPRIQDFQSRYPDIPLMLNPTAKVMELKPDGVEVAVRYRDSRKLDESVEPVLISDMVIMAKTSLIGDVELTHPAELETYTWMQELGTNEIEEWFLYHGVELKEPPMVTQMPGNLIMQGVRRGDGITYTARAFFKKEIEDGEMQVLFSDSAVGIYYLETCAKPLRPSVKIFVEWLKEQFERCVVDPEES